MPAPIASPWTPYGLSDDPFFQAPLAPTEDAARPISLFVGRDTEIRLLGGQIVGSGSSRAIVQGPAGVGKTSFVNRLKAALAEHGVLTHEQPVRVQAAMTPRQFCAEVLRVLIQIRSTAAADGPRDDVAFWRRVGRVVEGEDSVAAGITLGGMGAQRELVRIPAEVSDLSLIDDVIEAIRHIAGRERRPVLLHVNNLENLSPDDARAASTLMQVVRDAFLAECGHWLFVGAEDIERSVFRASPQVGGVIPFAVTLSPLSPLEVAELLARRYEHLRRGVRFTPPVEPRAAARLYERYGGDLRNFLRLLGRAVQQHGVAAPGETLSPTTLVSLMAPAYWSALVARLGASDAAHLAATYRDQHAGAEFRAIDLATRSGVSQPAAKKIVQRLVTAGMVEPARTERNSTYYRLRGGDPSIALGLAD